MTVLRSPSAQQGTRSALALSLACGMLVSLPVLGLWFAYHQPAGLLIPPPLSFAGLPALVLKTLGLATVVSACALGIGSWLAWTVTRHNFRGRSIVNTLAVVTLATPSYLVAAIIREEFAPAGTIGGMLDLQGQFTGFWPAALVLTVTCTPYVYLLMKAAFQESPQAEEEAARCLGATGFRIFSQILWPRIRTSLSFALILVCMYVVSDFGAVAVLDCEVLTWELYKARGSRDAIILGFGLMGTVLPLLAGIRLVHGETRQEIGIVQRKQSRPRSSGGATALTWILLFVIAGFGVVLPCTALLNWLISGLRHGIDFAPVLRPALWTLLYAGLGSTFVLILAFLPAYLSTKMNQKQSGLVENLIYLTSSVPGILVAVGLLQLVIGLKRTTDDSSWMTGILAYGEACGVILMIGYGMRFLSQAYASLKPTMQRLDVRQTESARLLGASAARRWWLVTIPAMKPGLIAAFTILFLSIAKELPITLMLIPLGQTTLAYRIFDAQQEGALPDVGLAGLTLLLMALLLQVTINRRRAHD